MKDKAANIIAIITVIVLILIACVGWTFAVVNGDKTELKERVASLESNYTLTREDVAKMNQHLADIDKKLDMLIDIFNKVFD